MKSLVQTDSVSNQLFCLEELDEFDDRFFFEEKRPQPTVEKYIVFAIDEEFYTVHSSLVAEVLSPLPVTNLPNAPDWLCGAANLRGEIISVIDLRRFWHKTTKPPARNKFIVLRSKKDSTKIAFVVDRFSEPVRLSPNDIKFSAADYENSSPMLCGKAFDNGNTLLMIDAEKLLSSLMSVNLYSR